MYEKNIVGVYLHQVEYPVFQHQVYGERRVDPNKYETDPLQAFASLLGDVDDHDPLEKWREESEHEREHPHDQQHSQHSGSQHQGEDQGQDGAQLANQPSAAALAQGEHAVDDMIAARVLSHILPASAVRPAIPAPQAAEQVLQAMQRHLNEVTHALPDDHEHIHHIEQVGPQSAAPGTLCVRDVMHRQVVCVRQEVSLEQAASVCNRRGFSGLPVVDAAKRLVGEFSVQVLMKDLFAPAILQQFAQHDTELLETQMLGILHEPVSRHMRQELFTVAPETSVREACQLMHRQGLRRLIVTEGEAIVGLFTAQDAVRLLAATSFQAA